MRESEGAKVAKQSIETMLTLWQSGQMEKYEFYDATIGYPAKSVAAATGIDIDVIRDRRRYLRQLAKQAAKYAARL